MTTWVPRSNKLLLPWDTVLKKPVQSSLIFVRLGQGIFKSDYITRYLHDWVVLTVVYSLIGASPRVCSKHNNWHYLLLIWGGAKASSITIELLLFDRDRTTFAGWTTQILRIVFCSISIDRTHDRQHALGRIQYFVPSYKQTTTTPPK